MKGGSQGNPQKKAQTLGFSICSDSIVPDNSESMSPHTAFLATLRVRAFRPAHFMDENTEVQRGEVVDPGTHRRESGGMQTRALAPNCWELRLPGGLLVAPC